MSIDSQISVDAFASIRAALAIADAMPTRKRSAVTRSPEFDRIRALPCRDPYAYGPALVDALTEVFAKHRYSVNPAKFGTPVRLLETQAIPLYEIAAFEGFIGNITMGGGKTLLSFLACAGYRSLIILPAKLIAKTREEMREYALDWRIPGNITLISYDKLSRVSHATYLEDLAPQRIICDEGHKLKNKTAMRKRIDRYLKKSKASFVVFSGTMIGETLRTWAHAADWALHLRSPAPRTWATQTEWSAALARDSTIDPGALKDFGEDFRDGYRVRVEYSPGSFVTGGSGVGNALEIERFETALSPALRACLRSLEDTWELPTGEVLNDPLAVYRALRQLELGCYYRWKVQPPDAWREARLNWSRTVREVVRYSRSLDTEQAVVNAIDRGGLAAAKPFLLEWRALRETFKPDSECIWIDRDPVREIAARARGGEPAIVWLHHAEIGNAFAAEGLEYYGAGGLNARGEFIETATGKTPIAASIESNSEGRNLQFAFGRSVIAELAREPLRLEQLIARTHRTGQIRDCVEIEVNTSTDSSKRAWLRVLDRAAHIQKTSGQAQRLLSATHVNPIGAIEIRALDERE